MSLLSSEAAEDSIFNHSERVLERDDAHGRYALASGVVVLAFPAPLKIVLGETFLFVNGESVFCWGFLVDSGLNLGLARVPGFNLFHNGL